MITPTISIDLGASYTKVAYRRPLSRHPPNQFATRDTEIAVVQGTAMIPSIMIKTGDSKRPWIAGKSAASLKPAGKMEVFDNWKSTLFSSVSDARKVKFAWIAAGEFFKWLLKKMKVLGVACNNEYLVRVTIPNLKRCKEKKGALIKCMRSKGWPKRIEVVVEPVADIIGVLSGGRNVVSAGGQMSYQSTFGPVLVATDFTMRRRDRDAECERLDYVFDAIRNYALGNRRKKYMRISVVDFGSFSLDLANVTLDLEVEYGDKFPVDRVSEKSWEIGVIEEIDRPCFIDLFTWHGIDGSSLSFELKESLKVYLYSGRAWSSSLFPQGFVKLGESDEDKQTVRSRLDSYCNRSWKQLMDAWTKPELVILTGGGICIHHVRKFFRDRLTRKGVKVVEDFSSANMNLAGHGKISKLCDWRHAGEHLGRIATALGGASIGFGFDPDESCRRYRPPGSPL